MKRSESDTSATTPRPAVIDDPEVLATQAREAVEKNATELRKARVPISSEPPTVYRP